MPGLEPFHLQHLRAGLAKLAQGLAQPAVAADMGASAASPSAPRAEGFFADVPQEHAAVDNAPVLAFESIPTAAPSPAAAKQAGAYFRELTWEGGAAPSTAVAQVATNARDALSSGWFFRAIPWDGGETKSLAPDVALARRAAPPEGISSDLIMAATHSAIKASWGNVAGAGEVRGVHIDAPKVQVLTLFFYPLRPCNCRSS